MTAAADTAFDVLFRRPCSCLEHHAVTGTCPQIMPAQAEQTAPRVPVESRHGPI